MYKGLSAKILGPMISSGGRNTASQLTFHRGVVLALTFIVYATYHAARRPLSIVKAELHKNCTATPASAAVDSLLSNDTECGWAPFDKENGKELLGVMDSCYLFLYAFCMFGAGYVAERSNLRVFLSVWLVVCGAISIAFGMAKFFKIHSLWYFVVLQMAAGVAQTSGWPAVVAVVGEWFGNTKKGLILGLWNWHTSVGNIMGAAVAGAFVEDDWGLSFAVPGLICFGVAILVFFFLIPKPTSVGLHVDFTPTEEEAVDDGLEEANSADNNNNNNNKTGRKNDKSEAGQFPVDDGMYTIALGETQSSSKETLEHQPLDHGEEAITILKAIRIPGVIEFSLCLFFAKLVSYTFLFWLPLYLEETSHLSSSSSAFQSIMFDIGGCLGSIVAGFMADRSGASGITCIIFLTLAIPSLYSYYLWSATSTLLNQVLQFIAGAFVNGPYALITTAVSANLACKVPSQAAMATVSAIIDGTGSIGAAVGPLLAGVVSGNKQWINVFYMCIAADVIATLALIRIGLEDFRRLRGK